MKHVLHVYNYGMLSSFQFPHVILSQWNPQDHEGSLWRRVSIQYKEFIKFYMFMNKKYWNIYVYISFYTSEFSFREGDLRVIRPFVYVREKDLRLFAEKVFLALLLNYSYQKQCSTCKENISFGNHTFNKISTFST